VAAAGGHEQAHVTQQIETGFEAFIRIAFLEEWPEKGIALTQQGLLYFIAHTVYFLGIVLLEVQVFQLSVQRDKSLPYPCVKIFSIQ
jgi:hypothetical protein